MPERVVVAIDAMGGDAGPALTVPASVAALESLPTLELRLVGKPEDIEPRLPRASRALSERVTVVPASEVVDMDEPPADALRRKKDSSMRIALELVRSGAAGACVSAGNTGALMALSCFVVKTIQGIDRPAIISAIPSARGHTHMLDLGANSNCSARQLFQFAVMGSVVAEDVHGIAEPKVGLLNIGTEETKGNDTIRLAGQMLRRSTLNYVGFVEGHDIMSGRVDVVVTDGFTGNVSLKTMEGAVRMLFVTAREEIGRKLTHRLSALAAKPLIDSLGARLDPRRYNGATLVGLRGIVIKSHGGADEMAFGNAIRTAVLEAEKGVPSQIGRLLEQQRVEERVV